MSYLCRYILLTLLFLFAFFVGLGQESFVISCQVVDDVRGKPLPNVYVALNNTRKGTSTSARGVFKIEVAENELDNDLFLSYTGYYDTLIPCRQLLNSDQILLRSFKVELQDIDVVAELNKEICFGDTAYMFSDEAAKAIPYHLDYGHSVGCILKNKSWGYIEKIYLNIANDNYFGAKFAVRIKRIQHSKKYWLGIKNLNLFKDVVAKPIVIEPEMSGVICINISALRAFIPERNDILVLLYPLEEMGDLSNYKPGYYPATRRRPGNINVSVYSYTPKKPKGITPIFLMNNDCVEAKLMSPLQIALTMRSYEKE